MTGIQTCALPISSDQHERSQRLPEAYVSSELDAERLEVLQQPLYGAALHFYMLARPQCVDGVADGGEDDAAFAVVDSHSF